MSSCLKTYSFLWGIRVENEFLNQLTFIPTAYALPCLTMPTKATLQEDSSQGALGTRSMSEIRAIDVINPRDFLFLCPFG